MKAYYLKFASEQEAKSILYTEQMTWDAETETEVGTGEYRPNFRNISVIGLMYNDDAVLDENGDIVTPATAKEGWHVNVLALDGEDASGLEAYDTAPATPARIWGVMIDG